VEAQAPKSEALATDVEPEADEAGPDTSGRRGRRRRRLAGD
jgi:hypothetical protein